MKYLQQYINLSKTYRGLDESLLWAEGLKDIVPPSDDEYTWTILNTHVTYQSCLIVIWEGKPVQRSYGRAVMD